MCDSNTRTLLAPPKIYLDTAHLINIAKLRDGDAPRGEKVDAYSRLDECIRDRHFGLIYSQSAALDWVDGGATLQSATQIAEVVDSAKLQYFYEGDTWIYIHEVLQECTRHEPSLEVPSFPILQQLSSSDDVVTAFGTLVTTIPDYVEPGEIPCDPARFPRTIPNVSARRLVRETYRYRRQNPATYQERVDGFIAALSEDIAGRPRGDFSRGDFVDWAKRFLRIDRIIRHENPGVDIEQLLGKVDLARCPGTKLWWAARSKRIRAGHSARDNDVDDWILIPCIPYCDVTLTDSAFREVLLQADRSLKSSVFSDPDHAVRAIEALWNS